ncbi:DNA phosphorothioation-associated putative methyltransferase [Roseomonas sp. KE2513]|uniref:DNA phosphorothioation-associated putative methyltransferase n=1 Tax=Roseomonas sp. KE2513 TaxID=2479202 RepID=UPI0018E02056|nr:DNA phosphorothioation-associated putative methyltransferase [Roseomonas sp. KE2513]
MAPPRPARQVGGKRVGGAVYLHASAIDDQTRSVVERAVALADGFDWNVVKIAPGSVSLLLYEDFDTAGFPALLASLKVDLETGKATATDYRKRENPPILHRKETLLPADAPQRPRFAALTRAAEEHGLFAEPTRIGTRRQWSELLASKGLHVEGHSIVPVGAEAIEVARHKTAIPRRDLSQPMQLAIAHGVLPPGNTVFDYGCGLGDDVAALSAAGYEAFGWDPHHASDGPRRAADLVNLGFVLNVVEDRHERRETLRAAWSFARRALVVAVMVMGKADLTALRPYRDGHLTSRGTFQKYFGQQELRDFIEEALGEAPLAIGQGVFAVFRDKDLEQEVLFRRQARAIVRPVGMRPPERNRSRAAPRPGLAERIRPELETLWVAMLQRGRALDGDELPADLLGRLQAAKVSPARATSLCLSDLFEQGELATAASGRREDLLVHFAMLMFPGAPRYANLARSIQRDVRTFFGSHAAALEEARRHMFSAGKPEAISEGVEAAVAAGLGAMRDEETFRFAVPTLDRLPPAVRLRALCGGLLRGGVEGADFIDMKIGAPRLTFIQCMNASARLPVISETTRVDLGRARVTVDRPDGMVLYLKGRFLPVDAPKREEQVEFDRRLLVAGIVTPDGKGPRLAELQELMRKRRGSRSTSPAPAQAAVDGMVAGPPATKAAS